MFVSISAVALGKYYKSLNWEVHVATFYCGCEDLNEKKFETLEKERSDEMEVAKKALKEREA